VIKGFFRPAYLGAFLIAVLIVYSLFDNTVVLEPFIVPKSLEEARISSQLLARRVVDELWSMRSAVSLQVAARGFQCRLEN